MSVINKVAEKGTGPGWARSAAPACEAVGQTDRGRVRRGNEDALGIDLEHGAFVVCDGMGGAAGGETASRMAVESLLETLRAVEPGAEAFETAVRTANAAVFARAASDRRLEGMGTTLVALLLGKGVGWVAHVGDSRCYRMRGGGLKRLTRDHSWVEEQVRLGRMTAGQARRSPMGNMITRAVGTRLQVLPEVWQTELQPDDLFLLASDGLTRELSDETIARILAQTPDLGAACQALVNAANAAGGRDNVTCLLVRVK